MESSRSELRERALNLKYCVNDVVDGFQRLSDSPMDSAARERWLRAVEKCVGASQEYITAATRPSALASVIGPPPIQEVLWG
jgi:hypothetical protein